MFSGVQGNVSPGAIWKRKPLKHGFHMIAAITLKKKFSDIAIIWKLLSSNHSNSLTTIAEIEKVLSWRSLSLRSQQLLERGFHMIGMIVVIASLFFLSDRSDDIETRL